MNTTAISTTENINPVSVFRHELGSMENQFQAALPAHIPVERFVRVLQTSVQQNPDLLKCSRRSLWNSAMKAAQDGLLPDGREGAIVPYKGQAQWMPMIAGIRKKVRNSGEIATCHGHGHSRGRGRGRGRGQDRGRGHGRGRDRGRGRGRAR